MNKIEIKKNFEAACGLYVNAFCIRHGMDFCGWVRGRVGEVAKIGDYFLGMDEIRYDVDAEPPIGEIHMWVDYMNKLSDFGCTKRINYESFCKGARLYSQEDFEQIEAAHKRVEEAQRHLKECMEDADSPH